VEKVAEEESKTDELRADISQLRDELRELSAHLRERQRSAWD
jgi:peptidoglycan hydrolase CwlO-like protein